MRQTKAKKEAKRLEKEAKLAAKAAKTPVGSAEDGKKLKAEKKEKEVEPEYVNTTPKGQKKGAKTTLLSHLKHSNMY